MADFEEMRVCLSSGYFVGTCMRCSQPSTSAEFNSDSEDEPVNVIKMKCVSCGFKTHLRFDNVLSFEICGGDNG